MKKLATICTFRAFGDPCVPDGQCLCPSTSVRHWQDEHWDRRRLLSEAIREFESIIISPELTSEVVNNQRTIEQRISTIFCNTSSSSLGKKGDNNMYSIGNKVLYCASDGSHVDAVIAAVHHDDYPNTYYTITFENGEERQTVASRLQPVDAILSHDSGTNSFCFETLKPIASLSEPTIISQLATTRSISIIVSHVGRSFAIDIDPELYVRDLKDKIASIISIPSEKLRLLCKGTWLKNEDEMIKCTKVEHGSKVTCMGSK